MANIDKIVCTWSGFAGAPGYTAFYFSASQGPSMQPKVLTFWQSIASFLPPVVNIAIPTSGETIDETTGKMVNTWSGGSVGSVNGTGSVAFASTSGALIRWNTGRFANGRAVRGRTFIVPLYAAAYASGGTITPSIANTIKAAADALNSLGGQLVVWSRPVYDHSTNPPTLKRPGISYPVTSTVCPTKVTYLSSRRD